jgi:dCTP deaminase
MKTEIQEGAIVDSQIKGLKLNECFKPIIDLKHISPASLDLITEEERYRISRMTLPKPGEKVRDIFEKMGASKVKQKSSEYIFERNVKHLIYLGKVTKKFPENIWAHVSPKSSTGRVDVHVKLMADGVPFYDTVPAGFTGELWLLVIPQSFPVIIPAGETLSQIRFYKGLSKTNEAEFQSLLQGGLVLDRKYKQIKREQLTLRADKNSLIMTLDLNTKNPGFVCRKTDTVLDLSKRNHYDPKSFFETVQVRNGGLVLEPGAFYILSTKEVLDIPGNICGEMETSSYKLGEFRAV